MARAEAAPRLVLGTAGHIDHGKTALIRALTGTDTDRLPEERARGITIELGFAALDLEGGLRLSVVDVPGHERLVRTMVSGATGIDVVLLVIAADEGVMPQTREHVAICDLLGLSRGVVALTKADLADDEVRELAALEARELLAPTALADAETVCVSATTGEGLAALRAALSRAAQQSPAHAPSGGPTCSGMAQVAGSGMARLGIDRAFAMKGFGTVVTGTLAGGALTSGETLEIHPGGRHVRIRGLQSHGTPSPTVPPGVRCAVNLQGVDLDAVRDAEILVPPGSLSPTRALDVQLRWLPGAPTCSGPVSIELLVGTASRRARLAPIGGRGFQPGSRGFARIHVEGPPLALLPGDRFIVRGFARNPDGGATLGGGVVLDAHPPHRRRADPALRRELEVLQAGDPLQAILVRIARSGLHGQEIRTLALETGTAESALRPVLKKLAEAGRIHRAGSRRWLAASAVERLESQLCQALATYHAEQPLRPGMPRGALRGQLPDNVAGEAAELALARLEASGRICIESDRVRRADHVPRLDPGAKAAVDQIAQQAERAGLEPPSPRDWAERLGLSPERFRDLVAHLEREAVLIRAPGDIWFDRQAVLALQARVVAHLREHGELDTPTYKSLIGTTRRAAVPLMELFDALHVTHRVGAVRILRSG